MSNFKPLSTYKNIKNYHETVQLLRSFFLSKDFLEVETQSRQSILAACEDPSTITSYSLQNQQWPLPQTGQMWLEYELLKNPELPGLFCVTTSYRDEQFLNPTRHLRVFPMFEFEAHGTFADLEKLLKELFTYVGLGNAEDFQEELYETAAARFNTSIIDSMHEEKLCQMYHPVFLLKKFPLRTHPFWNMKQENGIAFKIDSLLYGMETVGSAERSTDPIQMHQSFLTVSNGTYAESLYRAFGKERVDKELDTFLALQFFKRFGGGIGIDRLIRALTLSKETQSLHHLMQGTQITDMASQQARLKML
ncbi:MAG TPA: amino acid--tRNA ligase-related protein [Patescibacteria group bacterium]|jgi:aspartyl/asparaginyl-tRNA synthetase|nr:amino acid--tRNA ligase-related protein [Patescibacteria group bacterium]